ncbi:30S ribosomal protein S9 [Candidatus Vidania fulgoroideorum]
MLGFYYYGLGIKKTAKAKVLIKKIKKCNGKITINNKPLLKYFNNGNILDYIYLPLALCEKKFNIKIYVSGGGVVSQALAIKMALSKAILNIDRSKKNILKYYKLLSIDNRIVERKKIGFKKSRKKKQFSKR